MQTLFCVNLSFGQPRQRVFRIKRSVFVSANSRKQASEKAIACVEEANTIGVSGSVWKVDSMFEVCKTPDNVVFHGAMYQSK